MSWNGVQVSMNWCLKTFEQWLNSSNFPTDKMSLLWYVLYNNEYT